MGRLGTKGKRRKSEILPKPEEKSQEEQEERQVKYDAAKSQRYD